MRKETNNLHQSKSHNVDYKADKKSFTAPLILESFIDDEGENVHILDNGNQQKETSYNAMWGKPKGENPCKKYNWMK